MSGDQWGFGAGPHHSGLGGSRTHAVVTSLVPECIIEVDSLSERAESLPSLVCSLAGGEQGGRLVFS